MLNRRTLRIKIMQSLFAYEQCKDADYLLALDSIDLFFQPDLNSMKVQDKVMLKGQLPVATSQFEKKFKGEAVKESADPRINQAVEEAFALHTKQLNKDFDYFRKMTVIEAEKISTYYFSALNLITTFASLASHDKKLSARNFSSSPLVLSLIENIILKKESGKTGSAWDHRMEIVRGWFRDCIKPDKEFQGYLKQSSPTLDDHKAFAKHLVRKLILGNTIINSYFEEEDQRWAEDHEIVRSMVDKTLKSYNEETKAVEIQKLSLDWEEDKGFIDKLFIGAIRLDKSYHDLIAENTKNWEVDRLPLTDQVILHMAIVEMIDFPNIPVKVTINEYIELAKQYSTPKSRQFINGILDVIAKELRGSGKIKKSGRGLMDNK